MMWTFPRPVWVLALAFLPGTVLAQATNQAECAARSAAGAEAVKRRSKVALYYALKLAVSHGRPFEWRAEARPRQVPIQAAHVAVNAGHGFAIDAGNRAWRWPAGGERHEFLLDEVAYLAAGETSLLAIRCDGSLWQLHPGKRDWQKIADAAIHAWVGDSADYFIDPEQTLYASGKAHRGQYGDGRLQDSQGWVAVARDAVAVYSHTGHAVYLRRDGAVLGTGGNIYGPLGAHGYGDKATRWGVIFEGAVGLGTGSRHSMAIRADGRLWSWGVADGPEPRPVLAGVTAAIGGDTETLALTSDGSIWNWAVGATPAQVSLPP